MINQAAIDLIKRFEGCRLQAYRCPAGIPTIGYGHTHGVEMGDIITQDKADYLLVDDLTVVEQYIYSMVKVALTDNQCGALVAFTYNVGAAALRNSTLLKRLNEHNFAVAADEFLKWDKATVHGVKQTLAGLTKRRKAERDLFLTYDN